jgi:hypothetical protein
LVPSFDHLLETFAGIHGVSVTKTMVHAAVVGDTPHQQYETRAVTFQKCLDFRTFGGVSHVSIVGHVLRRGAVFAVGFTYSMLRHGRTDR